MPQIVSFHDGFFRTTRALKLLLGLVTSDEQRILFATQFGFHGYCISIYPSHFLYLADVNNFISPVLSEFDENVISRWRVTNELLISDSSLTSDINKIFGSDLSGLATLAVFTVLEEVSRRVSGAWDEEGVLLREVSALDGIVKWKPDGTTSVFTSKMGSRISSLEHKLQLMDSGLAPEVRATIASLSAAVQRPIVGDLPMSPLYPRLAFLRNEWMHGRKYTGWEAMLVTLVLSLVYFGHCGSRLAATGGAGGNAVHPIIQADVPSARRLSQTLGRQ